MVRTKETAVLLSAEKSAANLKRKLSGKGGPVKKKATPSTIYSSPEETEEPHDNDYQQSDEEEEEEDVDSGSESDDETPLAELKIKRPGPSSRKGKSGAAKPSLQPMAAKARTPNSVPRREVEEDDPGDLENPKLTENERLETVSGLWTITDVYDVSVY